MYIFLIIKHLKRDFLYVLIILRKFINTSKIIKLDFLRDDFTKKGFFWSNLFNSDLLITVIISVNV